MGAYKLRAGSSSPWAGGLLSPGRFQPGSGLEPAWRQQTVSSRGFPTKRLYWAAQVYEWTPKYILLVLLKASLTIALKKLILCVGRIVVGEDG
jgi:hypothetical protein